MSLDEYDRPIRNGPVNLILYRSFPEKEFNEDRKKI